MKFVMNFVKRCWTMLIAYAYSSSCYIQYNYLFNAIQWENHSLLLEIFIVKSKKVPKEILKLFRSYSEFQDFFGITIPNNKLWCEFDTTLFVFNVVWNKFCVTSDKMLIFIWPVLTRVSVLPVCFYERQKKKPFILEQFLFYETKYHIKQHQT